jgi:hypothetical protein
MGAGSAMLGIIISGPWPALQFLFYLSLQLSLGLLFLVPSDSAISIYKPRSHSKRLPSTEKIRNIAANLVAQPPIMPSPFRKLSPTLGDDPTSNDPFSQKSSSGTTSQRNIITTTQAPAPLQAESAKQAQNSKQPVTDIQSREQHNSGNLQPTHIALDRTTFIHPAELFKASWKNVRPRVVKRLEKNRAPSRYGTSFTRRTALRPKTTDVVARRLISQALGVNFCRERKTLSRMEESR